MNLSRRAWLGGSLGALALAGLGRAERAALARGRTPYGSSILMHVPWPVGTLDPHRIDDALAAFFGEALFDTLYARDEAGLAPSLAAGDPQPEGAGLRVPIRPGLRFSSGTPLDARAIATSLGRARAHDAGPWLADVPPPRPSADGLGLVFAMRDARVLVRALSSPLAAIVAPRFTPDRPEGTGPFRVERIEGGAGGGLRLVRNGFAASGPSYLDAIDARHAPDLETSLRAFESGADDLGWLGSFLHEPRAGALAFDAGAVGWALLRTGKLGGPLDAPGTAQALCDGVPHAALAPLVVGPPWSSPGGGGWTGAPCDLVVREDAPWLVEVAKAIAVPLSSAGHEVTVRPVSATEIATRRQTRIYALMIDVARPAGPDALGALVGVATADDPLTATDLARHPPRGDLSVRRATRTMRVGVLGEVRLQGGRAPDVSLPASPSGRGVDWGSALRVRRASPPSGA
jgi:peptide/nickel transport system substrate-binding protein